MTEQQYLMILGTIYIAHFNPKWLNATIGIAFILASASMALHGVLK